MGESFGTKVYVVGEVLISVIALLGALGMLFYGGDQGAKLAASGLLSAVTVFWFQRRQAEQANNNMAMLADGKLTQLLEAQQAQQVRSDALVTLLAQVARTQPDAVAAAHGVVQPVPPAPSQ